MKIQLFDSEKERVSGIQRDVKYIKYIKNPSRSVIENLIRCHPDDAAYYLEHFDYTKDDLLEILDNAHCWYRDEGSQFKKIVETRKVTFEEAIARLYSHKRNHDIKRDIIEAAGNYLETKSNLYYELDRLDQNLPKQWMTLLGKFLDDLKNFPGSINAELTIFLTHLYRKHYSYMASSMTKKVFESIENAYDKILCDFSVSYDLVDKGFEEYFDEVVDLFLCRVNHDMFKYFIAHKRVANKLGYALKKHYDDLKDLNYDVDVLLLEAAKASQFVGFIPKKFDMTSPDKVALLNNVISTEGCSYESVWEFLMTHVFCELPESVKKTILDKE